LLTRLKDRGAAIWTNQRARHDWLDHSVRAWTQLGQTNGSLLAGALTFFSFLALFPLVLLAVAIAGFVFASNPNLERELFDKIAEQAPGKFGDTIKEAITTAIDAKTGVGIVALAGVLLTGLGWVNNLRQATEQVWGHKPPKRSFLAAKIADLSVLVGLGLGLIISVGITAVGSALSGTILRATHLDTIPGASWLTLVIGIAVGVAADLLIFAFLLVRLPKAEVPREVALRGTLLTAIGFEILKLFGTYYIAKVSTSPTVGAFGSIIGVLVWLNLVFRYLLYCTAWTATGAKAPSAVEAGVGPVGIKSPGGPGDDVSAGLGRGFAWALILGALVRRRR
jgi:membrane protein